LVKSYIPDAGDIVWLDFDPQAGHEQSGKRPALVISPASYNSKTSLMLCCPITSQAKGYPFEVDLRVNKSVTGVVLSDQVKSLDWRARCASYKGKVTPNHLHDVKEKIKALLPK
jgi:mRNA interferase MazF